MAVRRSQRYWNKVLSEAERPLARKALHRWAMWAAKESAYKLEARLDAARPFQPKRYTTLRLEERESGWHGLIRGVQGTYPVAWRLQADLMLALCWRAGDPAPRWKTSPRPTAQSPGLAVRSLMQQVVQDYFPDPHSWCLQAPRGGIPSVVQPNHSRSVPVSFSHHGTYVAVAWPAQLCL